MILRMGDRGAKVQDLQRRLNELGFGPLVEDGILGPASASSVRLYQASVRLPVDGVAGPQTLGRLGAAASGPTARFPAIVRRCEALGHPIHVDGQVSLIGVRSLSRQAGAFDDWMFLVWAEDGAWSLRRYAITTDPGIPWLESSSARGTAILAPGSWPVYKFDLHQGRVGYRTLCQRAGTVQVYRDATGDSTLDMDPDSLDDGWFGINIHHAGEDSTLVGRWSAGCQVFKRKADWSAAMDICEARIPADGIFTYTLIEETES